MQAKSSPSVLYVINDYSLFLRNVSECWLCSPSNDCSYGTKGLADSLTTPALSPSSNTSISRSHIKRAEQSSGNRSQRAVQAFAPLPLSKELLLYLCAASLLALWWCGSLNNLSLSPKESKIVYIWKIYDEIHDDAHIWVEHSMQYWYC